MKDEILNESFQTIQSAINKKALKGTIETNLRNLHVHIQIWRGHNKNAICWAFYCVNDGKDVDEGSPQVMLMSILLH
jgi:hypothetical protein